MYYLKLSTSFFTTIFRPRDAVLQLCDYFRRNFSKNDRSEFCFTAILNNRVGKQINEVTEFTKR